MTDCGYTYIPRRVGAIRLPSALSHAGCDTGLYPLRLP